MKRSFPVFATIFLSLAAALAQTTATRPGHEPLKPRKDVAGAENFAQISPDLYRGKQPTEEGFANLKKMGVKTVIDLRDKHDDAPVMKGAGLGLVKIPCGASTFTEADIVTFFKTVNDPANRPVFVHCERGADRTGLMVALYRIMEQGWTKEEAMAELPNFKFDKSKKKVTEYLITFDPAELKKKIEAGPPAKIEKID